jgi:DeoR/GlpR family transcriptional regulator of sugar metabolism
MERSDLFDLKQLLEAEPTVSIEVAASVLGVSVRTVRRHLNVFEVRRGVHRHLYLTVRSVARFLAQESYQPSRDFDATREFYSRLRTRHSRQ